MRQLLQALSNYFSDQEGVISQVPLVWWPWWPFNPADVYLNSVLPLERMLREGVIDSRVQLVPVLDGLRPPRFYQWWFAPLTDPPVRFRTPHARLEEKLVLQDTLF